MVGSSGNVKQGEASQRRDQANLSNLRYAGSGSRVYRLCALPSLRIGRDVRVYLGIALRAAGYLRRVSSNVQPVFAVNGVGIVLFSQITGRLASRTGETKLLTTGLLIAAFGGTSLLAITWLGGGLLLIAPMLFLIVSAVGMVSATTTSLAMQKQEAHTSGSASALLGLLPLLLGAAASPLVGLGDGTTAAPMGTVIGIAELLAVSSFLLVMPLSRRKETQVSL